VRNVSSTARQAMYSSSTEQVFLILLEIDHSDLSTPIRVVNNTQAVTHGGNTYSPYPFELMLPDDSEQIKQVRITIDNVDRMLMESIRTIDQDRPTVTFKVILASSPDTVEAGPFECVLASVTYSLMSITGVLIYEDRLRVKVPALEFTAKDFPGVF